MSPMQRSLRKWKELGYECHIVEHYDYWAKRKKDLFGFADILALGQNEVVVIQTTSASNLASRITKIANAEHVGAVRKAGIKIVAEGWRKGKEGWVCNERDLS